MSGLFLFGAYLLTPALVAAERSLYAELFAAVEPYSANSPGAFYATVFQQMTREHGWTVRSVLDAGCGTGKGALALAEAGYRVELCDLTDAGLVPEARRLPFHPVCLWDPPLPIGRFDAVYCCDVLEHIPPAFTMLTVSRLLEWAYDGVFLSISLVPDIYGVWVGQALHRTVQPFHVWRDQLAAVGHVVEARDLLHAGVYLVEPQR